MRGQIEAAQDVAEELPSQQQKKKLHKTVTQTSRHDNHRSLQ